MPSRGDQSLFAREDTVEAAWRVVDGVLDGDDPAASYEPGSWGPPEAASVLRARRSLARPDRDAGHPRGGDARGA